MRKSVRLILALFAVLTILTGTVAADEYDSRWVSFLDYDTGTSQGNYLNFTGSGEFSYTLPFTASVRSVQGIIQGSGRPITGVQFGRKGSDTRYPCTVLSLGNSMYRFYLSRTDLTMNANEFYLIVENDGSANTVTRLLEFEYSEVRSTMFAQTGSMDVNGAVYTMSSSTSSVSHTYSTASGSTLVKFYSSNWKYYDYLSFFVYQTGIEIQSLTARFGTFPVPVSVDYLNSGDSHAIDPRTSCMITIDLRGIDRNKTDVPILELSGYRSTSDVNASITLLGVTGIVEISETDPEMSILNRILNDMNWYLMNDFSIQTNMSGNIVSGFSDLTDAIAEHFESFQSLFTDTISGFRSSMESYLDALPARIAEELAKIFQPTEGHFEEAADQSSQLAEEKLGAVYQAAGVIDQIAGAFTEQTTQTFIAVPVLRVMVLPGVPFEFGGWEVPVVPPGMESVFEVVKFAVDIVCTLAFLNGMKRRLERFLGGTSDAD